MSEATAVSQKTRLGQLSRGNILFSGGLGTVGRFVLSYGKEGSDQLRCYP